MPVYEVYWRAEGSFEVEADDYEDAEAKAFDLANSYRNSTDAEVCEVIEIEDED